MNDAKQLGLFNYVVDGDGPPVILIHGLWASLADWCRLLPILISAGYQAITPDLLGHGDSAKPTDPTLYSFDALYAALEEWIDRLGLDPPFYLVGCSLGGYLSLSYALNHPDRVRAMALLNPLYSRKQLARTLGILRRLAPAGVHLLQAAPQGLINLLMSHSDSMLTALDAEARWAYSHDFKRASPHVLQILNNAPDLTPRLSSITPPTLVLWGVRDRVENGRSLRQLVSGLAHGTGKSIPDCGRYPHQVKPELAGWLILDFFKRHPLHAKEPAAPAGIMQIEPARVAAQIEEFIRRQVDTFQREGVILGLSGGIDSAVVASLAVRAIGPDQVKVLLLPERDSSPESRADALIEIQRLGIQYQQVSLAPMLTALGAYRLTPLQLLGPRTIRAAVVQQQHRAQAKALGEMPFQAGLLGTRSLGEKKQLIDAGNAYARVKHRMRMTVLYYHAEIENRLVLGTTNRSEASTGFVVKWGDNVADVEPLLPLYKTQVYQLATYLGVSDPIVAKAPSPDLIPGIVDSLALGLDYYTLDRILWGLDRGWSEQKIADTLRVTIAQIKHVQEMWRRSDHMRRLPPVPDLD